MKNQTTMKLEGDRVIVITRTFDAPPPIVFDAWTKPELVRRWWAPKSRGLEMTVCDADVRVGGSYRYVLRRGAADVAAFSGKYQEIAPPSRLVYSQVLEPFTEHAIVTITFTASGRQTQLVAHEAYPSAQVRDMVIASGMEDGMRETMDLLDALVASL